MNLFPSVKIEYHFGGPGKLQAVSIFVEYASYIWITDILTTIKLHKCIDRNMTIPRYETFYIWLKTYM